MVAGGQGAGALCVGLAVLVHLVVVGAAKAEFGLAFFQVGEVFEVVVNGTDVFGNVGQAHLGFALLVVLV